MNIYKRIKDLREDGEKKQSEVAQALSMHLTQYGRYERGEREIPLRIAIQLARYYNVSLDYIAGLSNQKYENEFQITETEHELIDLFRSLNAFEQGQLFERAKSLSNNKKIADINKENKNCL